MDLPEVGVTGSGDRLRHVAFTAVVGGHREKPVAGEVIVQELEVACRGARRHLGIRALVDPVILVEAEATAGRRDELPDALGGGVAECSGFPDALDLREPDQVGRNPFFLEDLLRHLPVTAGAAKSRLHRSASAASGEIADELEDRRIDRELEVIVAVERRHLGISKRGEVSVAERGELRFRRNVGLLRETLGLDVLSHHLVMVDLLDELAIVGLERLVLPDVDVARQDRIDGVVERSAGPIEVILPECSLTHLEEILGPIDNCSRLRVSRARRCGRHVRRAAGRCRLGEND